MPRRAKGTGGTKAAKKPIEQYNHKGKTRANIPPVGLVTPQTDPPTPARKTYAYPKGWNQKRADEIARYYDNQSDEEAIAEVEAAYRSGRVTMMAIPVELVPQVQRLLAKRAG